MPAGRRTVLRGRSWSGTAPVRRVEVSTDGGGHWRRPTSTPATGAGRGPAGRCRGSPAGPGAHELLARATDRDGVTQPDTVPFNQLGYQFWAVVRHPVVAA